MKACITCKIEKHEETYYKNRGECKSCVINRSTRYWRNNRDAVEDNRLKRLYRISLEYYNKLVNLQDGRCLSCNNKSKLFVDHDHRSGDFRGLICRRCNLIIGQAKDNIEILRNNINYLLRFAA